MDDRRERVLSLTAEEHQIISENSPVVVTKALCNADIRHVLPRRTLTLLDHHSRTIIEDWKNT